MNTCTRRLSLPFCDVQVTWTYPFTGSQCVGLSADDNLGDIFGYTKATIGH